MPELSDSDRDLLFALRDEFAWRFSNGRVDPTGIAQFGNPLEALQLLENLGLVVYKFYGTGAVHPFSITASGREHLTH